MTTASASEAIQARAIKQSSIPTCFTKASRENNLETTQQPERTVKATAVEEAGANVGILDAVPLPAANRDGTQCGYADEHHVVAT